MMKNVLNFLITGLFAAVVIFSASCDEGYKTTGTGMKYKFHVRSGNDTTAKVGDIIKISMRYGPKDSTLFTTDKVGGFVVLEVKEPVFKGDIFEGFQLMAVGDSATFVISADSFFKILAHAPQVPEFIDSGSYLYFDIKMLERKTKAEYQMEEMARFDTLRKQEEEMLARYINDNNITVEPTESGLYFIETEKGKGKKVEEGDYLTVNYRMTLLDGTEVYSTYERKRPVNFEFGKPFNDEGFVEGVGMLRKSGKAKLVLPSKIAYGERGRGQTIPPFSTVIYEVELVDVKDKVTYQKEKEAMRKDQELQQKLDLEQRKKDEPDKISTYLKNNQINVKPTASGLYYITVKDGEGINPYPGDAVTVHYTLYQLSGRKLQSSIDYDKPFEFTVGRGEVIPGWDEGIPMMKEGGVAKFIIPSKLAYGEKGAGNDIPPYSPLLFEVELLKVVPQPAK